MSHSRAGGQKVPKLKGQKQEPIGAYTIYKDILSRNLNLKAMWVFFLALHTWVGCRNDGPKEEAVSEVKISPKLTHNFHEGYKAIHDQSGRKKSEKKVMKD